MGGDFAILPLNLNFLATPLGLIYFISYSESQALRPLQAGLEKILSQKLFSWYLMKNRCGVSCSPYFLCLTPEIQ